MFLEASGETIGGIGRASCGRASGAEPGSPARNEEVASTVLCPVPAGSVRLSPWVSFSQESLQHVPSRGRRQELAPSRQGRRGCCLCWKSGDSCSSSDPTSLLGDLGQVTGLSEAPFHLCNGCLQFLPLPCDTQETELVTGLDEPPVCHVSGGLLLVLIIMHSPVSSEKLGLLGLGGTAGEDRLLRYQRGRDLLKATGATCLP